LPDQGPQHLLSGLCPGGDVGRATARCPDPVSGIAVAPAEESLFQILDAERMPSPSWGPLPAAGRGPGGGTLGVHHQPGPQVVAPAPGGTAPGRRAQANTGPNRPGPVVRERPAKYVGVFATQRLATAGRSNRAGGEEVVPGSAGRR